MQNFFYGSQYTKYLEEEQQQIPKTDKKFISISAGSYYSLGLLEDGSILAWGDNMHGQTTVPKIYIFIYFDLSQSKSFLPTKYISTHSKHLYYFIIHFGLFV